MALFHCNFFSHTLGLCSSVYVILPQPEPDEKTRLPQAAEGRKWPVLYLLHGLSDDHTIWQRRTAIERYADKLPLAVVMPAVHRSFYMDMAMGYHYGTYIAEELPRLMRAFFPISDQRAETYVAGLSMGGYGAFKLALTYPERYAAAASLSGVVDVKEIGREVDDAVWMNEVSHIFPDPRHIAGTIDDLFFLSQQVMLHEGPKPKLYQWCGTEDFLYSQNVHFRAHAEKLGMDLTYSEGPGGHEWVHWDDQIEKVLAWLPLPDRVR